MKHVCFLIHNWHYIPMQQSVREELALRGVVCSVFILRTPDRRYFTRLKELQQRDSFVHGFTPGLLTHVINGLLRVPAFGTFVVILISFFFARRYFKHHHIDLIATSDDRSLSFHMAALIAAKCMHVPVVLLPIETVSSAEALMGDKSLHSFQHTSMRRMLYAIIRTVYKESVGTFHGREAFFYPIHSLIPFLPFRPFLPRNPWLRGSNPATTLIAANSRAQIEENVRHGMPRSMMELTGFPPHDAFSRRDKVSVREKFAQQYPVGHKRLFLLVGTHFAGEFPMKQLQAVQEELRRVYRLIFAEVPDDYVIVVKLHPQSHEVDMDLFGQISRKVIFVRDEWSVYDLALIADAVFLFTSSVVLAAMATNVPVFAYKLQFPSFEGVYRPFTSIRRLSSVEDLQNEMKQIVSPLSGAWRQKRQRDREEVGMFDGKNTLRVADLVEQLLKTG